VSYSEIIGSKNWSSASIIEDLRYHEVVEGGLSIMATPA